MAVDLAEREGAVREAVEGVYGVFARYKLAGRVEGCPHCVFEGDVETLHSQRLRKLGWAELEKYSWKAMTTWGDVKDFKHFLPRLLELLCGETPTGSDKEVIIGKLAYGEWWTWPAAEQGAVRGWLMAVWRWKRLAWAEWQEVWDWLCTIGQAEREMGAYLEDWLTEPRGWEAVAEMLVEEGSWVAAKGRLPDAFWEGRREQAEQVVAWLGSAEVRGWLERGFFEAEGDLAERVSVAVEVQGAIGRRAGRG